MLECLLRYNSKQFLSPALPLSRPPFTLLRDALARQVDYLTHVFAPVVAAMGVRFDVRVLRRGFFPRVR